MHKRVAVVALTAALAIISLAGCQAIGPGSFTRADARADVATWTQDAEATLGSPTTRVRFDGFEVCRTDHGYFTTTSQWRTATTLSMPRARQSAAMSTVSESFVTRGWNSSKSNGAVTLTGPKGAHHTGQIRIEPYGSTSLLVSVVSPCHS
jgi:predicted small lipoprotein YifL